MSERYVGFVDGLTAEGWLHGWAIDLGMPERPLRLVFDADGRRLGEARADQIRADVLKAGHRTEVCGFALPLPAWAADGVERMLSIRTEAGEVVDLAGLAAVRHDGATPAADATMSQRRAAFDYIRGGRIGGWSLDLGTRQPVPVEIWADGRPVAADACQGFRGDLFAAFGARGGAFERELPAHLFDGRPHAISVRAGVVEAAGGPRTLTPGDQQVHRAAGALQVNGLTGAESIDPVAAVLTAAGAASAETTVASAHLAGDLMVHALYGRPYGAPESLAARLIKAGVFPLAGAATARLLSGLQPHPALRQAVPLATTFEAESIGAALALSAGDAEGASRLVDVGERAGSSEALTRLCAERLLAAGRVAEAVSVLAASVAADRAAGEAARRGAD